ncbi:MULTISPECIES: ABC transporter ATP-binding protein [Bacillus]|uniref:ABC transporter ATP-binding protein n=1 Tax=Bacillus inaquosorum TaxID=483913 RepID=A0A9Q4EPA8_9BACI|nr:MULTISPECIES: ABC transporter ATP-binding protein [Bacillus]PPA36689.1 ABC transporter ATP-binding protein [Bacillus subtilis]MBT2190737.1 ABC transporter ATP-binding protein [Bacillus inaquosorum]MBT3117145.1 ABC transporter ATP-binding protein [Bacillus inaquosorum]MBT3120380.1 ABC transporter ATP-binding protein [Bacillus inaquosorum]MCY7751280.1 ABC transporter ATP-binding protein [Bacillus inaquosorum]
MMNEAVSVSNVTKHFQQKTAVNNISFSIEKGEIAAILGPNGAGKTTVISMILGLLKPTKGEIKLFNRLPDDQRVREKIGVMLQEVSVMPGLKVNEILELFRSYYPNPLSMKELVSLTALTKEDLKTRAEKLSGGQKRRLSFALALAGNPELLIFDEPTVGMDTSSRHRFWQTIHGLADQGKTIIFSTHYLQEADDAAQRILFFADGRLVADDSPMQLRSRIQKQSVSFTLHSDESLEKLSRHPEVERVIQKHQRTIIQTSNTDKVLALIFQENIHARDIRIEQGTLDEAFRQLADGNREAM